MTTKKDVNDDSVKWQNQMEFNQKLTEALTYLVTNFAEISIKQRIQLDRIEQLLTKKEAI